MPNPKTSDQVDVRGPRFAAWVTTAVLVAILLLSEVNPAAASFVAAAQTVVFAIGAVGGPRRHPYGLVFARLIAPRLSPVADREPVAPLKFAQLVGLLFVAPAAVGFASGAVLFGVVLTAAALVAAFLNAAFGICLGCQLYPLVARLKPAHSTSQ
jgi:hypothetical protein